MKTLILGLGNPILGDDALGLRVAALVRQRLPPDSEIEVGEEYWGGLRLMERLIGYDKAILVDAICTGAHPPGTILRLGLDDLPTQHTASSHDVNLPTALEMGRTMGMKMPDDICIIAVEAENILDFSEQCSPAVTAALPDAADKVLAVAS